VSGRRDGCPDNLLARSWRGVLSLVEQRALDAHLGVCGSCRATLALRNLYEQSPDQPSSDERAVVARLAERVTLRGNPGRDRTRPVAFAAGAALIAVAGAAAAWVALQRAPTATTTIEASRPHPITERPAQPAAPASKPESPAATEPPIVGASAMSKRAVEARHVHATTADARDAFVSDRAGAGGPSDDASALFAAANAARGAGDLRTAARRYDLLERLYPASPEATVSLVSDGDVLMRLGEGSAALEHFDRYLARSGQGPLALEALFGKARALRDLGRSSDELETWRELLRRFPKSLYETTARRRVDELSR
jgi:TolA-binding protein